MCGELLPKLYSMWYQERLSDCRFPQRVSVADLNFGVHIPSVVGKERGDRPHTDVSTQLSPNPKAPNPNPASHNV